jgi:hypothetical protein
MREDFSYRRSAMSFFLLSPHLAFSLWYLFQFLKEPAGQVVKFGDLSAIGEMVFFFLAIPFMYWVFAPIAAVFSGELALPISTWLVSWIPAVTSGLLFWWIVAGLCEKPSFKRLAKPFQVLCFSISGATSSTLVLSVCLAVSAIMKLPSIEKHSITFATAIDMIVVVACVGAILGVVNFWILRGNLIDVKVSS